MSGELRFRPEGLASARPRRGRRSTDNYLLQRYLFGADVRLGRRVRVFAELQSGIINGKLQSPRPTDRNPVDLHQAFVELRQPVRQNDRLTRHRRAPGDRDRQLEADLGQSRPERQAQLRRRGVCLSRSVVALAAVGAALVTLRAGAFDDRSDGEQLFWGVRGGPERTALARSDLGAYYLGIDSDQSFYAQGRGPERRHTVGGKWSGAGAALDFNYDVLFQWGRFAGAPIRAWAFATETGFRLPVRAVETAISVRTDIAVGRSRCRRPRSSQSFNPLFPGNAYSAPSACSDRPISPISRPR